MEKRELIIYLAGSYGFSEITKVGIEIIKQFLNQYGKLIDPFELNISLGKEISQISNESSLISKTKLEDLSRQIALNNCKAIQQSDLIFAILDGVDVDSGTAAEIGYAFGMGKMIFGYRSDFRLAGDNPAVCINLQVEYFIRAQGGVIFRSSSDLYSEFPKYIDDWRLKHYS